MEQVIYYNKPDEEDPEILGHNLIEATIKCNGTSRKVWRSSPLTSEQVGYKSQQVKDLLSNIKEIATTRRQLYINTTDPLYAQAAVMTTRGKKSEAEDLISQAESLIEEIKAANPYPTITDEIQSWLQTDDVSLFTKFKNIIKTTTNYSLLDSEEVTEEITKQCEELGLDASKILGS